MQIDLSTIPSSISETLKNVHLATHLLIWHNTYLILISESKIFVYSLSHISTNKAALIAVHPLKLTYIIHEHSFEQCQREHYEDPITGIFRSVITQTITEDTFKNSLTPSSNIFLKPSTFKHRLQYLSELRVKKIQMGTSYLLILLEDGRCATWSINPHNPNYIPFTNNSPDNLQLITSNIKQPILQAYLDESKDMLPTLWLYVDNHIQLYDLQKKDIVVKVYLPLEGVNELYSCYRGEDHGYWLSISLDCTIWHGLINPNQSAILKHFTTSFNMFITSTIFYSSHYYTITATTIYKCLYNEEKDKKIIHHSEISFTIPLIDEFDNYVVLNSNMTKSIPMFVTMTINGVLIAVIGRINGNYKEGRIVVYQPCIDRYIYLLAHQLKKATLTLNTNTTLHPTITNNLNTKNCYHYHPTCVNIADSIFLTSCANKKEKLSSYYRELKQKSKKESTTIILFDLNFTLREFEIFIIDLELALLGKSTLKDKLIVKMLKDAIGTPNCDNILTRCCHSGQLIQEEQVNKCKSCDIYGIVDKGYRCPVCLLKMTLLED